MTDHGVRAFFRIVHSDPPTEADFLPYAARGGAVPTDPALRRLWHGISVYDTLERARSRAIKQPALGGYLAELAIPWGREIRAERTGHRRGHHTLWGEPQALLACVIRVVSV